MSIEIDDPRLTDLVDPEASVERLAAGCVWTEGRLVSCSHGRRPAFSPDESTLYVSDTSAVRTEAADDIRRVGLGVPCPATGSRILVG